MKISLSSTVFLLGLSMTSQNLMAAEAMDTGIYLGVNAGPGFTNWKDSSGNAFGDRNNGRVVAVSGDRGLVSRLFLGYDINKYFAVEAGYSYFFNRPNVNVVSVGRGNNSSNNPVNSGDIKTQALDLCGKGKLPILDTLDLYTKAGIGYLMSDQGNWGKYNNINLAFSLGADYKFTQNFIANIEWLRIAGYSTMNNNYTPDVYAAMVGLRYKFNM